MTDSNSNGALKNTQFKMTTRQFIEKAKKIHFDKYDYSEVVYCGSHGKVKIICPTHGPFFQESRQHLKGQGCLACAGKMPLTTNEFISKVSSIHNNFYDYSLVEYRGRAHKVKIICPKHGLFEQEAKEHYRYGCYHCGNDKIKEKLSSNTSEFIEKAKALHGDKYNYDLTNYRGNKIKVKIICKFHKSFMQTPNDHLMGVGCPQCKNEISLWKRSDYVKLCDERHDGKSNLYLIKCYSSNEVFYKIGITVKKIKNRFSYDMPYSYEVIKFISESASFVWDLEKKLHRLLVDYKYTPNIQFGGANECFSVIPKDTLKLLDSLDSSKQLQLIA